MSKNFTNTLITSVISGLIVWYITSKLRAPCPQEKTGMMA